MEASEQLLTSIAARIKSLGLERVAVTLLEMHKPLAGIFQAGFLVFEPALNVLVGPKYAHASRQIFESPEYMQTLINYLEDKG